MKFTNDQLRMFVTGAVSIKEEDGYLSFRRFSDKQTAYYRSTSSDFYGKSFATSGVRVAMTTDADEISFAFRTKKASSRHFYFVDMCVDGVLVAHEGKTDVVDDAGIMTFTLPAGTHLVELYMPNLYSLEIKDMELIGATKAETVRKKYRMLAFGDSITQGYDATFSSLSYANITADLLNATLVDQAIGGEVFNPGIIDGDIDFKPDFITVAYGTNDFSRSTREVMERDAGEFYRRLREAFPDAKIFAMMPIWRADTTSKVRVLGTFEDAKEIVRAAASAQPNTVVIDCDGFVPHHPDFFSDLRLHPNDIGFKFYAEALARVIKPQL